VCFALRLTLDRGFMMHNVAASNQTLFFRAFSKVLLNYF
jgi:hypothetical protein